MDRGEGISHCDADHSCSGLHGQGGQPRDLFSPPTGVVNHLGDLHVEHASCGRKLDEGVIRDLVNAAPLALALALPILPADSPLFSTWARLLAAVLVAQCRRSLMVFSPL